MTDDDAPELEAFFAATKLLAVARMNGAITQTQVDVAVAGAALALRVDAVAFIKRTADLVQDQHRAQVARGAS